MKFNLVLQKDCQPTVTVVCDRVSPIVMEIERLCQQDDATVTVFSDDEMLPLSIDEITCFFTVDNRVDCFVGEVRYRTKLRIKHLNQLNSGFVKINQGCVVNVKCVKKFDVSLGGSLKVVLNNGFSDYVSRREVKNVKRRFGL